MSCFNKEVPTTFKNSAFKNVLDKWPKWPNWPIFCNLTRFWQFKLKWCGDCLNLIQFWQSRTFVTCGDHLKLFSKTDTCGDHSNMYNSIYITSGDHLKSFSKTVTCGDLSNPYYSSLAPMVTIQKSDLGSGPRFPVADLGVRDRGPLPSPL